MLHFNKTIFQNRQQAILGPWTPVCQPLSSWEENKEENIEIVRLLLCGFVKWRWDGVDLRQTTRHFLPKDGFIQDQHKIAIQNLQVWWAVCNSPHSPRGREQKQTLLQREKGRWKGYGKLAEFILRKETFFFFWRAWEILLLVSQLYLPDGIFLALFFFFLTSCWLFSDAAIMSVI